MHCQRRARLVVFPLLLLLSATVAVAKDGDLDLTFGGTGQVLTAFDPTGPINSDLAFSVVVQPDRKIVVAGFASDVIDPSDFALSRYNPDGSLDSSFGSGGLARGGFGFFSFEQAFSLLRQPDGKLVVGGWTGSGVPGGNDVGLLRFLPNGSLDPSFGSGGKVITNLGGDDWALALARQSDGKLLVGGRTGPLGNHNFVVVRYLANGAVDTTFGTAGKVVTDFNGREDSVLKLAVVPGGKILAVGTSQMAGTGLSKVALARYTAQGRLDPTFGTGGKVFLTLGRSVGVSDVALLPAGKFLVVGGLDLPGSTAGLDFLMFRFLANGRLDTTFGTAGRITTSFGPRWDLAADVAVLPNGKILVAGEVEASNGGSADGAFGVARYNANGQLDPTFGVAGKVTTRFGTTSGARGLAMAIQPDGKPVVVGHVFDIDSPELGVRFGVARYLNTP